MTYIATNAWAILVATAAGLLLGVAWQAVLGRTTPPDRPEIALLGLVAILGEAWLCAILAGALILAPPAGPSPWVMAIASAIVIWIGFVLPTILVTGLHGGLGAARTAGYAIHWLAVMLVQAACLQAIGLAKPA